MERIHSLKKIPLIACVISIWLIYAIAYNLLKSSYFSALAAGIMLYITLITLDILLFAYSFGLHKINSNQRTRFVFVLFAISFLCLIGLDSFYSLIYSILKLPELKQTHNLFITYDGFYMGYLLFQLAGWILIVAGFKTNNLATYTPLIVLALTVIFISSLLLKNNYTAFSINWIYEVIETLVLILNFIAAALCLVTTNNRGIFYLALGFLITISEDLFMNYDSLSQKLGIGGFIETSWLVALIFMLYGLVQLKREDFHDVTPINWLRFNETNPDF